VTVKIQIAVQKKDKDLNVHGIFHQLNG